MAWSKDSIFLNADYIVIEYIDIVKSPYLMLLGSMRKNDRIREILKLEQVDNLDDISLYEWYINRKHQNFLIDLNRYPDQISNEDLDVLLDDQLGITPIFYEYANLLSIGSLLALKWSDKLAKDIIIYHPHNNNYAEKNLNNIFNREFHFMNNFDDVMDLAKSNSTYFLSDINKINTMKEKDILKLSSITLPIEYRYNKKNMNDFKIDFEELFKENPFKLSYMRTCTVEADEPEEDTDE